jgi:glutamate dehydrogenase (NAD(P)+)
VKTERLDGVDAFVVFDLDDADTATGLVRLAPKILVDGATWLARSVTYQCASFEVRAGGASGGINAKGDGRAVALRAFVEAASPLVASGRWLVDPGKGVGDDDLAPLRAVDPRGDAYWEGRDRLLARSVAVAADVAGGGLDGRRVAIEGFDATGATVAAAVADRGGRVTAVGTAAGTAIRAEGFTPSELAAAWAAQGPTLVDELGGEGSTPSAVLGADVDVLVVGSRAGVLGHDEAAGVRAALVVPGGPIPVTAKALASLRRRDVVVLPDFITTAGPLIAALPLGATPSADELDATVEARVAGSLGEVLGGERGPLLAACERAEAFLRTWRPELPFGRPLAA